jgi:hypothetical protein
VRTTLLGQLSLLWLIDALADVDGVQVISANTDGLTLKVHRDLVDWVKREMNRATGEIDLSLSWQQYRMIARRDVNNYIAVTAEGKVKAKGSYGYDQNDLGRKATQPDRRRRGAGVLHQRRAAGGHHPRLCRYQGIP